MSSSQTEIKSQYNAEETTTPNYKTQSKIVTNIQSLNSS